jgi:hypothetical protein
VRIRRQFTLLLASGILCAVAIPCIAQNVDAGSSQDDVYLQFEVVGGTQQYHIGELIPFLYSYRTRIPGRYLQVDRSEKLSGGRPFSVSCSPAVEPAVKLTAPPGHDAFLTLLNAPCGGYGGSIGSGCADCDSERLLGDTPLSFGPIPLNTYAHFRTPGKYTCQAATADVTTAPREAASRPAISLQSNRIELAVVDDPAWAKSAAAEYGSAYEKLCGDIAPSNTGISQCFDISRRITFLDTRDSLAVEVKWFDGKQQSWENGFWAAIQNSSQPEEALRLMTIRIQEPDFQVSEWALAWLASAELRQDTPHAFENGEQESGHFLAVNMLRKYVRLLGTSLPAKNPSVLPVSVATYRHFAEATYCGQDSLLAPEEIRQALEGLNLPGQ